MRCPFTSDTRLNAWPILPVELSVSAGGLLAVWTGIGAASDGNDTSRSTSRPTLVLACSKHRVAIRLRYFLAAAGPRVRFIIA